MTRCSSCLTEDCDRVVKEQSVRMVNYAYLVTCCEKERKRLQDAEDLKRAGIRQDRVAGLHRLSGIPEKFRDVKLSDFEITFDNGTAAKAAYNFAHGQTLNVLLIGNLGVGKTMLGCAALNHIINTRAVECRYIYTPDLFDMIRDSFDDPTLSKLRITEVCNLPCIFLDDPGVAKDSEWTQSLYMQIIDARYREKRPTFMASNEGMAKLEQILGARSMSRIVESFEIVGVKGGDRRLAR